MRAPILAIAALLVVGCKSTERTFQESLDPEGLFTVSSRVDRGSFEYLGTSESTIAVEGVSRGFGGTDRQAARREAGNTVTIEAEGSTAIVDASSEYRRAEVDFDVVGPSVMDTDVELQRGEVHLEQVEGDHLVTASRITSRELIGNADLLARSGGMDVEIWPFRDGRVILESSAGDVVLWLPYGGEYDIEVIGDPAYEMLIEDLGFHSDYAEPGYFSGVVGEGSIEITVYVNGGSFELLESTL